MLLPAAVGARFMMMPPSAPAARSWWMWSHVGGHIGDGQRTFHVPRGGIVSDEPAAGRRGDDLRHLLCAGGRGQQDAAADLAPDLATHMGSAVGVEVQAAHAKLVDVRGRHHGAGSAP